MKKLINGFLLVLFSLSAAAQVCENSKLNAIIKQSKTDSVQKIERLAALKFHKLINEYRVKDGAVALAWDDTLWLTCRNHNIWMDSDAELSHDETPGTKNFTGKSPGERYDYTSNKHGGCSWSGENALYNWNKTGRSIEEISANIASTCFNQWKNSPGHNQNMLAKHSKIHGVAFCLGKGGRVWGTDLFAYRSSCQKYESPVKIKDSDPIVVSPVPQKKQPEVKVPSKKYIRLNLETEKNNLINALYSLRDAKDRNCAKISKSMEKAAAHHSEYMATAKQLTHLEMKGKGNFYGENEKRRMMKASKGLYFFKTYKAVESVALVETDISDFNADSISRKISLQLNNNKKVEGKTSGIGYGISLKRLKNQLKIYVTRIEGIKQSSEKINTVLVSN